MRTLALSLVAALILVGLAGCGGGGGGTAPAGGKGSITFGVTWPQAARGMQTKTIPAAASSIKIEIFRGGSSTPEQTVIINSPGTTVVADGVAPGVVLVRVTAYPEPNAQGVALATAETLVTVVAGQTSQCALTLASTISTVTVSPNPASVAVRGITPLTATAKDGAGNIVLVPASGGFTWTILSGGAFFSVDANGVLSGNALGSGSVQATEKESGVSGTASVQVTSASPAPGTGTAYGTVTDATATSGTSRVRTAAGLTGGLSGVNVTTSDGTQLYQTTSAADGTYQLGGVPVGSRVLSFSHAGYHTTGKVVVMTESAIQVDAALTPATGTGPTRPPQITLNDPAVDQSSGLGTLTGTITGLDSNDAVLIQNGEETIMPATGGAFSQVVVLRSGLNHLAIRATNAAGTTISRTVDVNYTGSATGNFIFRVTMSWDRGTVADSTDIDLHILSPSGQLSWYVNKAINAGFLDVDNMTGFGPENFTCNVLEAGRFGVATYFYGGMGPTNVTVRVTTGTMATGPAVNQVFGPFALDAAGGPWRPCDVLLDTSGVVTTAPPDPSICVSGVIAGSTSARKPRK